MALMCAILPNHAYSQMDSIKTAPGDALVDVKTTAGDLTIRLYGDTPKHRDNFIKLVKEGYYNGLLFHRVISEFMIQTGDPDSKNAPAGKHLGSGGPGYQLDAEIIAPKYFHKRGALAAARTGDNVNPLRRSSGSQFYIVTGRKFSPAQLDQMEIGLRNQQMQAIFNRLAMENRDTVMALQQAGDTQGVHRLEQELVKKTEEEAAANPLHFTAEQREAYVNAGGAPHLDGSYTVFGEVVAGMDTVGKIERAETDAADRPREDIRIISMSVRE